MTTVVCSTVALHAKDDEGDLQRAVIGWGGGILQP